MIDAVSAHARTRARRAALQALYQWQLARQDVGEVERQFLSEQEMGRLDLEYFRELLHGVPKNLTELDDSFRDLLDRPMSQLDPVELNILRIGAYELARRPELPWRVIIDEGVRLAKTFGAEEGHKYVNGVLDRLARRLRGTETTLKPSNGGGGER